MKTKLYILIGLILLGCSPRDNTELFNKACILEEEGEFEKAIEVLTEAIEIVPDDIDCFNNRAWNYYETGDFDNAYKDFYEILVHSNQNTGALFGIAYLKFEEKEYQQAITLFDKIIAIRGGGPFYLERVDNDFFGQAPVEADMKQVHFYKNLSQEKLDSKLQQ